jgi:hypothetical protein
MGETLKLLVYVVFSLNIILLACGKKKNGAAPIAPKNVPETYAIDGSEWVVAKKSCGSQQQVISSVEKFRFDSGFFVHFFLVSEDQSRRCIQADVFSRTIEQSSKKNDTYHETAILLGQAKRIVCKDRTSGDVLSDVTTSSSESEQSVNINLDANHGTADLTGSPFCLRGVLHIELSKKSDL